MCVKSSEARRATKLSNCSCDERLAISPGRQDANVEEYSVLKNTSDTKLKKNLFI